MEPFSSLSLITALWGQSLFKIAHHRRLKVVNHLAIAKEFIKEKLKERDDIVAVYIGGSVACLGILPRKRNGW